MHLEIFRNPDLARKLAGQITRLSERLCDSRDPVRLMEVCGTHTMAIGRYGLRSLLPPSIKLLSGPGCPVCVTCERDIDSAIEIAKRYGVTITTFGDLFRVPGSRDSLEDARAAGADVKIVLSPFEAFEDAKTGAGREVIFLGIGFETTSPTIAATLKAANAENVDNFSVLPMMKEVPAALRAILDAREARIDGFILPGHVSAVIGTRPYAFIPEEFGIPCAVGGFEPVDILQAILLLLEQMAEDRPAVENGYSRVVSEEGNSYARELTKETFSVCDADWRAIGTIPQSGLEFSSDYESFDARSRFPVEVPDPVIPEGCICGKILFGLNQPRECSLFGTACTPGHPVGPCMVSSEGTCAAHFKYGEV
jgi:hydrogenase expression/formation protein HypD